MKDDRICEYCTYKNVPTRFSPCLGCPGNMDHLIKQREEKEETGSDDWTNDRNR